MKLTFLVGVCLFSLPLAVSVQAQTTPDINALIDQCYDNTREPAERRDICGTSLSQTDDPWAQAELLVGRGFAAVELEDYEAAETDYRAARLLAPSAAAPVRNMSYLEDTRGNPGLAMHWARLALEVAPAEPLAYEALLYLQTAGDDIPSCAPTLARLEPLLPHMTFDALSTLPDSYDYLIGDVAICLDWTDRDSEALEAFLAAEAIGLDEPHNRANIALMHYQLEQDDQAQERALAALALDGPEMNSVFALAGSYAFTQQFSEAAEVLRTYRDFFAEYGTDDELYSVVGWEAFLAGEVDIAHQVMEEWATLFGQYAQPPYPAGHSWDTLAQARTALGDVEGAMAAFALAIDTMAYPQDQIAFLRDTLTRLGYAPGEGRAALMASLRSCVETGPACRLIAAEGFEWTSEAE